MGRIIRKNLSQEAIVEKQCDRYSSDKKNYGLAGAHC